MNPDTRRWWRGRRRSSSSWHLAQVINDKVVSECSPHYEMPVTGDMAVGAEPPGKICGNCVTHLHRPVRATKMCSRCRKVKSFEEFYRIRKSRDGLAAWCSQCTNETRRMNRSGKPGKRQRKKIPDGRGHVEKSFRLDDETHGLVVLASEHFGVTQSYLFNAVLKKALLDFARHPERFTLE